MKVIKIKYISEDFDRHGNSRIYVRMPGTPKKRIRARLGTPEFWAEYQAATGRAEAIHQSGTLKPGFIYIVGSDNRPVKIGIAHDAKVRLAALQAGNPYRLKILRLFELPSKQAAALVERGVHVQMRGHRLEGEWFDLDVELAEEAIGGLAAELGYQTHVVKEQKVALNVSPVQGVAKSETKTLEKRS